MQNVIFNGSPRNGGNCDFASKIIQKHLGNGEIYPIAKAHISPCTACDYCATHYGECSQSFKNNKYVHNQVEQNQEKHSHIDEAPFYFQKLLNAHQLFFISPIYHYHVPAQLKAFLDRTQAWYHNPMQSEQGKKKYGLILLGARNKGEKLFEGASLTFKYALKSLNYELVTPLCFYGLEHKNDLAKNKDYQAKIMEYASSYKELPAY